MRIDINEFLQNRTREYLLPILRFSYGAGLRAKLQSPFKLAVGVGDDYDKQPEHRAIYILFKTTVFKEHFLSMLTWIRNQPFFIKDYPYDDMVSGNKHMVVIAIPPQYTETYDHFINGQYSKMYTREDVDRLFAYDTDTYKVLTRKPEAFDKMIAKLKVLYGDNITVVASDLEDGQLDLPITRDEEIFNFKRIVYDI